MTTCLFLTFRCRSAPAAAELAKLELHLRMTPKLTKALIHTASSADDPYVKNEAPPCVVLQLYFSKVNELEAALSRPRYGRLEKTRDEADNVAAGLCGHRHGHRSRSLLGTFGKVEIDVPRARLGPKVIAGNCPTIAARNFSSWER